MADGQVTLANWRQAPFSRWAFHHVRELVPSAEIANDPDDVHEWPIDRVEIGNMPIEADGVRPHSLDEFLVDTSTDGIVVARGGRIVFERYANGMTETRPHILMSVSKSLLGLVAGVLAASGELEPDRKVTDLVPEVGGTAYEGATIRHLLDMRSGSRSMKTISRPRGRLLPIARQPIGSRSIRARRHPICARSIAP